MGTTTETQPRHRAACQRLGRHGAYLMFASVIGFGLFAAGAHWTAVPPAALRGMIVLGLIGAALMVGAQLVDRSARRRRHAPAAPERPTAQPLRSSHDDA